MITDLNEAQFRLGSLVRPCVQSHDARDYLRMKQYRYSLLDLYRWTLPEAFHQHAYADRYRSYIEGEDLNNSHSRLEVGFLDQLKTLLPDVPWNEEWYAEDFAEQDTLRDGLPLMDLGINIYAEDVLEHLEPWFLVLVALSEQGQFVMSPCRDDLKDLFQEHGLWPVMQGALDSPIATSSTQRNAVRRRFNQELVPVRFVPMVINLIDKQTGNVWLDAESDYEQFPSGSSLHMPWEREAFAIVQRHGNQVNDYYQKLNDLNPWIAADPPAQLNHILDIWNLCLT